jgi:hypothetical protein
MRKRQRVKIGKSFFVPVLLKVVATNPDGSPRWLEIMGDQETAALEHGSREFYIVWGSEMLAGRGKQA